MSFSGSLDGIRPRLVVTILALAAWCGAPRWAASAQPATGEVHGSVTFELTGEPVHGATVLIVGPGLVAETGDDGTFTIRNVPAGTHEVLAIREHLTGTRVTVTVEPDGTAEVRLRLVLSPVHEEVTVTATAIGAETAFEAFNAVSALDSFELAKRASASVAEALEDQPGISTRSFGPGSSRPIIRGFDGDRVLIMEDGVRTGDLSSQSGDHGVTIDPQRLDRLEVVRGPATLLYGSNAVGGVINAIRPQDSLATSPLDGVRGQVTTDAGSANAQAGANGSFQYGTGTWALWGGGGSRRTADYATPLGTVANSRTRLSNSDAGFGYFGPHAYASVGYELEDGDYGVPFAGQLEGGAAGDMDTGAAISIESRKQTGRVNVGVHHLDSRLAEAVRVSVSLTDWHHDEIETEAGVSTTGTTFTNRTLVVRAEADEHAVGRLSGKYGVWLHRRDFDTVGEEALAPRTIQSSLAGFGYEQLDLGRARLQLGARVEYNDYSPSPRAAADAPESVGPVALHPPDTRGRRFTGVSGSAGVRIDLHDDVALVTNLSRSDRAPALEELYNFGPHAGNLAFEIGNPDLGTERTTGLDVSLRGRHPRFRGEVNLFYYAIQGFVFPGFTGQVADGLRVARFLQGDGRFAGVDASAAVNLYRRTWLRAGLGFTDAVLTETDEPLPRIPPLHGRLAVELPYDRLTVTPELSWAAAQRDVFRGETPTAGYTLVNLGASYTIPASHAAHVISVRAYNLTNQAYRLHTSFIKDLAPEIGRGVSVSYSLRVF